MFKARRARRRRAKERARADAILADAKIAAEAARQALRETRGPAGNGRLGNDKLGEAIQAAILGSVLPSVVDAIHQPVVAPRPPRAAKGGALLFLTGLGAGIGLAAWARREPPTASVVSEDDEWELANGANARAAKEAVNTTLERLDLAFRRAVKVAADGMGSTASVIADAAAPAAEKVTDQLKGARRRATAEVIRALDDLDDVWGDDGDDAEVTPPPTAKSKKPTARRPVEGKPVAASAAKKSAPRSTSTTPRPRKTASKPPKAAN